MFNLWMIHPPAEKKAVTESEVYVLITTCEIFCYLTNIQ